MGPKTYTITERGRVMMRALAPFIGESDATAATLSRIARLAATHNRLMEAECSVEMTERQAKRHEARVATVERTIRTLVKTLPIADGRKAYQGDPIVGPLGVELQGDPRGFTVKIVVPNAPREGNTWGLGGAFGFAGAS